MIPLTRETYHWTPLARALGARAAGREYAREIIYDSPPEVTSDCLANLRALGYLLLEGDIPTDDGLAAAGLAPYGEVLLIDTDGGCHTIPYDCIRECDPTEARYGRMYTPSVPGDRPEYHADSWERTVDLMLCADCNDPVRGPVIPGRGSSCPCWLLACDGNLYAILIDDDDLDMSEPVFAPVPWPPPWYTRESASVHDRAPNDTGSVAPVHHGALDKDTKKDTKPVAPVHHGALIECRRCGHPLDPATAGRLSSDLLPTGEPPCTEVYPVIYLTLTCRVCGHQLLADLEERDFADSPADDSQEAI